MARTRKAKNPDMDGNTSRATFLEHHDIIVEKLRLKKEADSALGNAYKSAERDGIDKKELKRAIADGNLSSDELAVRDRKYALYREWLSKPIGFQGQMDVAAAAEPNGHASDPAESEAVANHENNKAFEAGVTAGKAGADIASCPFDPGTEEHQSYSLGWSSGQRAAVEALGGATRTAANAH